MIDAAPFMLLLVPALALGGVPWAPAEGPAPAEGGTSVILFALAGADGGPGSATVVGGSDGTFLIQIGTPGEDAEESREANLAWALAAVTLAPARVAAGAAAPHDTPSWLDRMALSWRRVWRRALVLVGATKWISSLNVLEQDNRQRIHQHVRERPGVHAQELATALGLRRQTVLYHLRVLEEKGILTSRLRGRRYYYCAGVRLHPGSAPAGPVARALLGHLQAGARPKADLAKAVGLSPRGAGWHLQRLIEDKVVTCVRQGPRNVYALARDLPERGREAAPHFRANG